MRVVSQPVVDIAHTFHRGADPPQSRMDATLQFYRPAKAPMHLHAIFANRLHPLLFQGLYEHPIHNQGYWRKRNRPAAQPHNPLPALPWKPKWTFLRRCDRPVQPKLANCGLIRCDVLQPQFASRLLLNQTSLVPLIDSIRIPGTRNVLLAGGRVWTLPGSSINSK